MKGFLPAVALALTSIACTSPGSQPGVDAALFSKDVDCLDVRTDEAVAEGKLAGAVHVPIAEL